MVSRRCLLLLVLWISKPKSIFVLHANNCNMLNGQSIMQRFICRLDLVSKFGWSKTFLIRNHPICRRFFCWLLQFLHLATIKIKEQQALNTIIQNKNQHPRDLGFKLEKTNMKIRINIFQILFVCMCVCVCQFSGKTNSFYFFSPNLPKSRFRVGNSEN